MHIRPSLATLNEPARPKERTEARSFNRDPLLIAHAFASRVGCVLHFFEIKAELEFANTRVSFKGAPAKIRFHIPPWKSVPRCIYGMSTAGRFVHWKFKRI